METFIMILLVLVIAFVVGLLIKSSKDEPKANSGPKTKEKFINEKALELKMPKKLEEELNQEDISIKVTIKTDRSLAYARHPEILEAERLKYHEPQRALEILLPLCDVEKGIYVKHMCLFCYRQMKDPESEKQMIYRILDRIETVQPDECDELEYENMKCSTQKYLDRMKWVDTLIERKRIREEKAKLKANRPTK